MNKAWLKKLIPLTFYALLAVFLFFYIRSIDFAKLQNIDFTWSYFVLATFFALGFRYWGAFIWLVILKSLGAKQLRDVRGLVYVYAKSWLGRYIPGTAPWILGKIYFASQHGISKNKLAVSSLLEGALQIVVVMALAFVLIMLDSRLDVVDWQFKFLLLGVVILCVIALVPPIFNWLISKAYRFIRKKQLAAEHLANPRTIIQGASLYAIGSILSGLSFFFVAKAVYPELAFTDIWFVMGVTNLASAASMLAFFAPSGLGVREGIQLVLLTLIMPAELALVVTVVMRLWSIVIDFLFFGISALLQRPVKSQ